MILTRIKRGAVRTKLLINNHIRTIAKPRAHQTAKIWRSAAVTSLAAYTVVSPILALHPSRVKAASEESEPPSTQLIALETSKAITVQPSKEGVLQIIPESLAPVEVGKSPATLRQEAYAEQQAQLARDQEVARQQAVAAAEAARQAELARQRRIEAEEAALKARLVQAPPVVTTPVSTTSAPIPTTPSVSGSEDIRSRVLNAFGQAFGADQMQYISYIVEHESGFNPNSYNRNSGACGLFQALPCSKMGGMDITTQINWGIGYIRSRYGTPYSAYAFWISHHWY